MKTYNEKMEQVEKTIEDSKAYLKIYIDLLKRSIEEYENDPEGKIAGGWAIPGLIGIAGHGKNMVHVARQIEKALKDRNSLLLASVKKINKEQKIEVRNWEIVEEPGASS